ncbi:MAG: hypothetical protein F4139_08395, partial [Gemmatimonadetes bacterium]|nr:hypothetical protein [Gemmatimonadota bacterium]
MPKRPKGPGSAWTGPRARRFAQIGGAGGAVVAILLGLGPATGQERDCKLVKVGGYTDSRRQDSVNYTHRASGGIDYECTDGTRILADSAVVWEHSGNAFFFGNVHFEDPDTELDADSARYFDIRQELIAYSNVTLTDRKGGAVIRGETLSYLSESRFRDEDRILVYGGSPRATVHPARRPAAPVADAEAVGDSVPGEAGEAGADSVPGEAEDPAEGVPGEVSDPAADSLGEGEADVPTDSVSGEAEPPAADSLGEGVPVVPDSAGAEVAGTGEDTLGIAAGAPLIDSVGGGRGVAGEMPELARLDSLAGIPPEPETEAEGEVVPADTPVDSVTPLPYHVEAPRIMIDGRRFFRAGGGVVVTRDSLRALGDSLDYDQDVGSMLILGEASVEDSGFRLKGLSVSVTPTAGLDEEILAREEAELTGEDVLMTAPAIRLFLEDGQVGRLVALPAVPPLPGEGAEALDTAGLTPGDAARVRAMAEAAAAAAAAEDSLNAPDSVPRPSVVAAEFNLTGDSIEVLSPGQVLDVVTAVGAARADAMGQDSLVGEELPEVARNDWMEGETIIARFVTDESAEDTAAADPGPSPRRARLETLTAVNDARSLYRLHRSDTIQADGDTSDVAAAPAPDDLAQPGEEAPAGADDPGASPDDPAATGEDPEASGPVDEECDTTWADGEAPPELHYVMGNQITIFLEGRKVVKMEVAGRTAGYHFEPRPPDCEPVAGDSAAVVSDTAVTRPDTLTTSDTTATPTA